MSRAADAAALYELIAAGSRMLQVNVARLHEDNREALGLAWVAGREGGTAVRREAAGGFADRPPQPHPSQQHPGHRRHEGGLAERHTAAKRTSSPRA